MSTGREYKVGDVHCYLGTRDGREDRGFIHQVVLYARVVGQAKLPAVKTGCFVGYFFRWQCLLQLRPLRRRKNDKVLLRECRIMC